MTAIPSQLSHVRGPVDQPLLDLIIADALDRAADRWPGMTAVIVRHQNVRMSFAELRNAVDEVAFGLIAMGLEPGARIGIWSPNCVEWVLIQFAAARAGLILVCINPAYRALELEHALQLSGCAALVMSEAYRGSDYAAMLKAVAPRFADEGGSASDHLPELRHVFSTGKGDGHHIRPFAAIAAAGHGIDRQQLKQRMAAVAPDDATNIQFTSGTTGRPKGATLTHRNLVNNAWFTAGIERLGEGDALCLPLPLYHCFGMVLGSLACLLVGATAVYPAPAFDPGATLAAIADEKCAALYGVPTMFLGLMEHPDFASTDLSTLRTGIMGGAPCPEPVLRRVMNDMGMREVTIAFGMTETSPTSFQTSPTDAIHLRLETVGRVHPHIEARVVDKSGTVVARGVAGEIQVRGYSVMQGYWRDAERTAETINPDGWLSTGDVGTIDAEGYCRIVGREKDMIIRGGENVFPREVEDMLLTHTDVADAQVFGIADARLGEAVCAWVRPREGTKPDPEELREHCRARLSHFKVPRHICIVDDYPMTVTGKVQKFVMRERMAAMLADAPVIPSATGANSPSA
ncbi:MAG: AMP-binding protein [Sphingopyxis sp.]